MRAGALTLFLVRAMRIGLRVHGGDGSPRSADGDVGGRTVRVGERATLGALMGLGFHMIQEMFTNLDLLAALPPLVIAFAPAVVAPGVVRVLFRRQRLQ